MTLEPGQVKPLRFSCKPGEGRFQLTLQEQPAHPLGPYLKTLLEPYGGSWTFYRPEVLAAVATDDWKQKAADAQKAWVEKKADSEFVTVKQTFLQPGKEDRRKAGTQLIRLIEKYRGTKAAKEAAELLETLE